VDTHIFFGQLKVEERKKNKVYERVPDANVEERKNI
jgi:hypothetical protein